ncbi:MAG: BMP family ABC transporter substrate-binding protein [Lachnospiraceae bacterium]|nr:BMP family ABC transporter substrate-binding protein [Lachnospiraceae bacterium]
MKTEGKDDQRLYFILALSAILLLIVFLIRSFHIDNGDRQIVIGGVFTGESTDNGWNESHAEGLKTACDEMNCQFLMKEQVAESESALRTAVGELIDAGCSAIFLTGQGYGAYSDALAASYPNTAFFCLSHKGEAKNCISYYVRHYQVRFLAGIVAGKASQSGVVGYAAAMPDIQTKRGINAFALGMRYANPEAKLLVRFTGGFESEKKEKEAVKLLAEEGADVITYHEDKPYAIEQAEEEGLFSIGFDAVYEEYSDRFLTASLYDWDVVYSRLISDYLSGRANFSNGYKLGFSDTAVKLFPYSSLVSEETKELVGEGESRIFSTRDVFSGTIYDNQGVLRCGEDERISDYELFTGMDWFVEGVEIYEQ